MSSQSFREGASLEMGYKQVQSAKMNLDRIVMGPRLLVGALIREEI